MIVGDIKLSFKFLLNYFLLAFLFLFITYYYHLLYISIELLIIIFSGINFASSYSGKFCVTNLYDRKANQIPTAILSLTSFLVINCSFYNFYIYNYL